MRTSVSFGGRIAGVVFGLVFAGFGALFIGLFAMGFLGDAAKKDWPPVECRIVSSEVVPANGESGGFNAVVQFTAGSVQGTHREHAEEFAKAQVEAERFVPGRSLFGRKNPADPSEVVLDSTTGDSGKLIILPFLLIPLIFIVIGVGIVWKSLRGNASAKQHTQSISASGEGRGNTVVASLVLLFIGTLFTLIGGAATWFLAVGPLSKMVRSGSWTEQRCTVELSRVVSSRGSKGGRTYRPEILYRYEFGGKTYRSSQVSVFTVWSSGRDGKEETVRNYAVGSSAVCFVNPANPSEALLDRSWSWGMLLGLLPLIFVLVGIGLLVGGVKTRRKSKAALATTATALRQESGALRADDATTIVLKPAASPTMKVVGSLLVCLFWNGIVGVFVGIFINGLMKGRPEWILGVFMIPFVLIGFFLVGWFFKQLLALANPRPLLRLTPGTLRAGARFRVQWSFTGAVARMHRLRISLVGRESATYRRGTNTTTDKSIFTKFPVLETTDRGTMRAGEVELVLPTDSVATFDASNNKLQYMLAVEGEIARWPDVDDEFEMKVLPAAVGDAGEFHGEASGLELIEADGFRLGVREARRSFRPAEMIEGVAAWSLPVAPKDAEVRLFWFTEGKGTMDVGVVATERFSNLLSQDARPFRLQIPDGPLSVDGRLVSVKWALELVATATRESVLRWDLVVSPTGRPIQLGEIPAEEKAKKGWLRVERR